jgi:hypothetical protein
MRVTASATCCSCGSCASRVSLSKIWLQGKGEGATLGTSLGQRLLLSDACLVHHHPVTNKIVQDWGRQSGVAGIHHGAKGSYELLHFAYMPA